jgi:hypothetical protein
LACESIKSARKSVREDLELRWVTNLSEERKRFYLIATLLDPRTKMLSFRDNKYFPSWKDEGHAFLSMEFKSFYMKHTQGEVNHADGQVPKPSVLDHLLGVSSTSMDVDPSSVNGETELNACMRVQQVANDTDPLMSWKQHQQEFPRLARMTRQYLAVPASSASPKRLFSSVGLVKSDLRGSLLDTTLIDVMWAKPAPKIST